MLYEALCKLKSGFVSFPVRKEKCVHARCRKSVQIPTYDFSLHARTEKTTTIYGANVIIFEGIYGLYDKKIRDLMDLKVSLIILLDVKLTN